MRSPPESLFLVSNRETAQNKTFTYQLRSFYIEKSFFINILKRTPDYQVELLSFPEKKKKTLIGFLKKIKSMTTKY